MRSVYSRPLLDVKQTMPDALHDIFTRLFTETRNALRRYVRRRTGSRETAEEIVQEAFLRTYERADIVQTPRAFLFSTARNLAADVRRHHRATATDLAGDLADHEDATSCGPLEDLLIADEASQILKEAVDRLPPQCQAVFTLKVFHGCSYKEIAEKLGLSQKTVEKHIAVGLRRTHEYLHARYFEHSSPQAASRDGDEDRA